MSQIIRSKTDLKIAIRKLKEANSSIGLVPTMGALHEGHMSLVQMSNMQYDVTVATIFVNPTQFNNKKDLDKYPRTENEDIALLKAEGVEIIFIPDVDEIYASDSLVKLNFGFLETTMEGEHRPGHFNGVGLIVMKLFGLVEPSGAFFGQKDLQQFSIISVLVKDFDLPIKLHMAPIIRDHNGLALSSRNKRLNGEKLGLASKIYATLLMAKDHLVSGIKTGVVKEEVNAHINIENGIELEYFEIVDFETLQNISVFNEGDRVALCIAAYVAEVRLIDNIIIEL